MSTPNLRVLLGYGPRSRIPGKSSLGGAADVDRSSVFVLSSGIVCALVIGRTAMRRERRRTTTAIEGTIIDDEVGGTFDLPQASRVRGRPPPIAGVLFCAMLCQ